MIISVLEPLQYKTQYKVQKVQSSLLTSAAVDLCGDSLGVAAVAAIARKLLINDTTVGLPLVPQLRRGRAII